MYRYAFLVLTTGTGISLFQLFACTVVDDDVGARSHHIVTFFLSFFRLCNLVLLSLHYFRARLLHVL